MKITFNKNIFIGFALSLVLLIISSAASYTSIRNLLQSYRQVEHTSLVIQNLEMVLSAMKDAETGQRGFLVTGNPVHLELLEHAKPLIYQHIDAVKALTTDNEAQQQAGRLLHEMAVKRIERLEYLVNLRKRGILDQEKDLEAGRKYMDETRMLVKIMQNREQKLMELRTGKMNRFSTFTPVLIVAAATLAIIITVFFYLRVRKDFLQKTKLQRELEEKDADITHRIDLIRDVANRISSGDYTIRVSDAGKDGLGNLAFSLNKMAGFLENSFNQLSEKDWLQTGMNQLNEKIAGEQDLKRLSENIISFLVTYTRSQVGSFYILGSDRVLELAASHGMSVHDSRKYIPLGSGIIGQSASDRTMIVLEDIPEDYIRISFAAAELRPGNIIVFPVLFENQLKAVFEIGSVRTFPEITRELLKQLAERIGIVLNTTQNRAKLQELFEETQAQSEELLSQHGELENLNTELEAQAQRLQASEEELKVQQEELLQANQELEERSRLLEERNLQIVERNQQIQENAARLEQSTKYKSEFLANMSHELRTPLNSILLLSRLMTENTEKNLTEDQVSYAEVIQSSGQGLLSLIDEILDLSKIESGKMELEYAETSLSGITRDLSLLFRPVAEQKKLDFRIDLAEGMPSTIRTDKQRLEQILKNLISNALKFTTEGYVQLRVQPAPDDPSFLVFAVRDTGIGIPPEKQDAIFEAFQQADGSTRRKYGGTGLGLSISRELAKLLGGTINLTSEPGAGSEFTIRVPIDRAAQRHIMQKTAPGHERKTEPLKPEPVADPFTLAEIPEAIGDDRNEIRGADECILIVEDDTGFAKALLDFTRKRGYKAIVSVRGDEAITLAGQYKPLAILLDIQLPVKSGWDVMEALKSNPATRHIPVHIMSSFEAKKESLRKGAVNFINKPVMAEQLKALFLKLEQVLSKEHKKVLIVEENTHHAKALAYFLETFDVRAEISNTIPTSLDALHKDEIDCVILDMGIPGRHGYETLETIKENPGLENLPIIIFTGRNLSKIEAQKIRRYADSIVMKTAHSYQRILDEISLFLHLVEEKTSQMKTGSPAQSHLGALGEVLRNKTILVADDDVRNIFSISKALEKHQMKVISATDGREALRMLEEHPETDIVLMDIMMPEMDGYEAMRRIRRSSAFQNLPVIAVTAKAMTGDREKCVEAGASDYISKPVDMDQLLSLLRVWLYDKA